MFCYYPSLLFVDVTSLSMFSGLFSSFIGITCLASASIGYFFGPLKFWLRLVMFCGTMMVIHPSTMTDIAGVFLIIAVIAYQKFRLRVQPEVAA
jgi:TRAP-type uncharacterized transport system, fused permease components